MLVYFEEEVGNILIVVGHPLQPLNFVVDAFGYGRGEKWPRKFEQEDKWSADRPGMKFKYVPLSIVDLAALVG